MIRILVCLLVLCAIVGGGLFQSGVLRGQDHLSSTQPTARSRFLEADQGALDQVGRVLGGEVLLLRDGLTVAVNRQEDVDKRIIVIFNADEENPTATASFELKLEGPFGTPWVRYMGSVGETAGLTAWDDLNADGVFDLHTFVDPVSGESRVQILVGNRWVTRLHSLNPEDRTSPSVTDQGTFSFNVDSGNWEKMGSD